MWWQESQLNQETKEKAASYKDIPCLQDCFFFCLLCLIKDNSGFTGWPFCSAGGWMAAGLGGSISSGLPRKLRPSSWTTWWESQNILGRQTSSRTLGWRRKENKTKLIKRTRLSMDNGQKCGSSGIPQTCAELQFRCLLHVDRQVTCLTAAGERRAGDVPCAACAQWCIGLGHICRGPAIVAEGLGERRESETDIAWVEKARCWK